MSSQNDDFKVVKLLCNIYGNHNNGWIYLAVLRGAIANRNKRDVDVNIYTPNILFYEKVNFNVGEKVKYLGMDTEEENSESRAYSSGYEELNTLIQNNESYCIITIHETYFNGLFLN